jgi:hypothetical protein
VGIFILQLLLSYGVQSDLVFVLWGLALVLIAMPVGAHFFTDRNRNWQDFPLIEFTVWLAVVFVFVGFLWVFADIIEDMSKELTVAILRRGKRHPCLKVSHRVMY